MERESVAFPRCAPAALLYAKYLGVPDRFQIQGALPELQHTDKPKKRIPPMKTIINTISKTGLRLRCAGLLLAIVSLAAALSSASAGIQVPFTGTAEGAIASAVPGPGGVALTVLATGSATQLGEFSREETLLLDPGTGTVTGQIVFTAANGDQLRCLVAGGFTSPTTVAGTYTFAGGSGRFANATGAAVFTASTPDGVHFSLQFSGTLSSVGANKK
jgi:hypothetical protein